MHDANDSARISKTSLPVILIAAVVQGWALYGLYYATKHALWPATDSAWLISLYTVALLLPTTAQLLAEHAKSAANWIIFAGLNTAFFYFGWHQGNAVYDSSDKLSGFDTLFPYELALAVFWLMVLPFVQVRLQEGQWLPRYNLLFLLAWRNHMLLAEAALFTGLFWLLLFLWASLFHMLGINYFKELFVEPIFAYPVTSLAFGIALHLIGSIERWITVVLEQILNVLKWLAVVAGVILVLFSIALIIKLPTVVFTGQRAIGAAWLLWLVAVVVLFLNAAYRDGSIEQPYPTWIGRILKWTVPLTIISALTAVYALVIRTEHYGLTVDRIWAFVVAGAALIYTVGYSASAFSNRWLTSIAPVNVTVALALIAAIAVMQTPLLSPYRLSADSQYRMALAMDKTTPNTGKYREDPFHYLRFDAGRYGAQKLQLLAELQNHPQAELIRAKAKAAQAQKSKWDYQSPTAIDTVIDQVAIFPQGRTLDANLRVVIVNDLKQPHADFSINSSSGEIIGLYIDLNGDAVEEFVLQSYYLGRVYQNQAGKWVPVAKTHIKGSGNTWANIKEKAGAGNFSAALPEWKDLMIGGQAFGVDSK
jgi:hypothetical protein